MRGLIVSRVDQASHLRVSVCSSPGCVPSKVMKICMNSTGVNKIEQTDKLLLETLHETRSKSEAEEEERGGG